MLLQFRSHSLSAIKAPSSGLSATFSPDGEKGQWASKSQSVGSHPPLAFLQTSPLPRGGEGQGEGAVLLRFRAHALSAAKAPSSGLSATFSPDGEKGQSTPNTENLKPRPPLLRQTTTSAQSPGNVRSPCQFPFVTPPRPVWLTELPAPTRTDTP